MAAEIAGPDPKALWRDQDRETDSVTLDQIHGMVRRYDQRTRRALLAFPIVLLIVAIVGGETWLKAHDLPGQVMAVAFILGEMATAYIAWRMLYPARDPAEPAGAYLRRRLLRRLGYLRGRWMLAVSPLIPAIVLAQYIRFTHGHGSWLERVAPLLIVVAGVLIILARASRRARRIKAQLDELETLMLR
jgi:hypothetical protein